MVTFNVKTSRNSLCALTAVDKSVTFLGNSKLITIHGLLRPFMQERPPKMTNKINCIPHSKRKQTSKLLSKKSVGAYDVFLLLATVKPIIDWNLRKRRKRAPGFSSSNQFDSYEAFNVSGNQQ